MVELEDTKVHEAVRLGDSNLVEEALRDGLDPDAIGLYQWCPLHEAASNGDLDVVEILVKFKADPNKPDKLHASTPLHYAAREGHADCLQVLIKAGGKFDVKNADGVTPLDIAEEGCRDILDRERTKQFIELSLADARRVIHRSNRKESLKDIDSGTQDDNLKKSLMGRITPVAWDSIEVMDAGKQSLKETGTGLLQASFEYNSKSGAFKIRVWQIEDILLPPTEFSSISRIYVKGHLLPDKKGDSKRRTEEIKIDDGTKMESSFITLKKKSASEGFKAIFLPSTFKFAKPLVYKDIEKEMLPLKTVHLDICVRLKYSTKSLPVASFQLPLKDAVRKLRKEKFRVLPCINYSVPDNIHTTDPNDFVVVMEGMYANRTLSNPMLRKKTSYNLVKEETPERAMSDIQLKNVRAQSVESIPTVSVSLSSGEEELEELTEIKIHKGEKGVRGANHNVPVTVVDIHQEGATLPGSTEDVFVGIKVDTVNSAGNESSVMTVNIGRLESETMFSGTSDGSQTRAEEGNDISIPRIMVTGPDGSNDRGESVAIEMRHLLRQKMKSQVQSDMVEKKKVSSQKSKRNVDSSPKPGHVVDLRTDRGSKGSDKEEKASKTQSPCEDEVSTSAKRDANKQRVLKNVQRRRAEQKASRNIHKNRTDGETKEGEGGEGSPDVCFKTISEEAPKPRLSPERTKTNPKRSSNFSGHVSLEKSPPSRKKECNSSEISFVDVVDETSPKEQLSPRLKSKHVSLQKPIKGDVPPSPLLVKEINEIHDRRSEQTPAAGEERLKMPRARRSMNFGITPPLTKGIKTTDLVSPGQAVPLKEIGRGKPEQINKNSLESEKTKLSQVSI